MSTVGPGPCHEIGAKQGPARVHDRLFGLMRGGGSSGIELRTEECRLAFAPT